MCPAVSESCERLTGLRLAGMIAIDAFVLMTIYTGMRFVLLMDQSVMLLLDCVADLFRSATTVSSVKYSLALFVNVYGGRLKPGGFSALSEMKNSQMTAVIIRHLEKIRTCKLSGLLTTCTAGMYSILKNSVH